MFEDSGKRLTDLLHRSLFEHNPAKLQQLFDEILQLLSEKQLRLVEREKRASHSGTFDIFMGKPDRDAIWIETVNYALRLLLVRRAQIGIQPTVTF
jgi:hypothetical protein